MTVVTETDEAVRPDDVSATVLRLVAAMLPAGAQLTPDTDLRRFGLESLAMTRLWFSLRQQLGVDIPVQWLGGCPTPAALVERIAAELSAADGGGGSGGGATALQELVADPAARFEPFPLTDLQQAYLLAKDTRLGPDPIGCHLYREFEIPELDADRLAAAWRRVVDRHDMLRAVITSDGRQRVQERVEAVVVPVHDVAAHDLAAHIEAVRARLSHHRYDPNVWPLHSVEISRRPDGRGVAHLSLDVLLTDGHGLSVILDDWWRWYQDPEYQPGEPALSVRDCVREIAAQQKTAEHRDHLDYWVNRLTGLPDGPELVSRAAPASTERTALTGTISREQWRTIGELATDWDVSPTSVVLTLFAEAFAWLHVPRPFSLVLTANHRVRLPESAESVVGPFTSSIVLPMPDTLGDSLRAAVRGIHRQLWQDLDHAAVSGVAALRALRAKDRTAPPPVLPVVFTSLLGTGRPPGPDGGLAAVTGYAISQTTGVALDHQMWEWQGELHVRWDALPALFPTGALETLFAVFLNSLTELSVQDPETRAMNELQQAYCVPRAVSGPAPWDGCQAYHSFLVEDLHLDRLEAAWLRLVGAYDVLRTVVTRDGRLAVAPNLPARRHIPVIDLAALADPDAYLAELREAMVSRAFPMGRGPQSDLRVTLDAAGAATVHVTVDLTVNDGRSIHFLVRELFRLYADPDAPPVPTAPHSEYVQKQQSDRAHPDRESWIAHWRDRVADLPPGPALPEPDDAPDPARRRYEGRLTGWRAVRRLAEERGVTCDDLLAATLTQVLAREFAGPFSVPYVRWTPQTREFRPGEYTAMSWVTRDDPGLPLWDQAAAFRRVVAEDAEADGVRGLSELRKRVMRERRAKPFEMSVVYTALFDLTEQPLPAGVRLGPWLTCTPDVALDCISIMEDDELRFYWDVVEARFPGGLAARLFDEYRKLLDDLAGGRITPGSAEPDRLHEIVYEWNATDVEFLADGPVHRLFEKQARRRPDRVALRWAAGIMTYGELDALADRIARSLRRLGVGPETAVGVSVPRGPHMVATVLGVLKAGGFYVPLEPSLPAERAETIIEDAGLSLVCTTTTRRGWAVPAGVRALDVDVLDDASGPAGAASGSADRPDPGTTADSTAYVIFTSGSTGKPKGVAVTHRPVLNLLNWCYRTHGFAPDDVGLSVTSLGFDLSVFDVFGLLGCGAALYVADETEQRDPHLLLDILLSEPVTFWNSAPTTLNQLAPLFAARAGEPGADFLRLVYLSGDYTPLPLPDEVRALFPEARIVSLGGATEATVWSNWFEVGVVDPAWRSIPYGRPIDNAKYYILDEAMRPCLPGVEGDLYIGGDCLSLGYFRQPELTAERFLPNPFVDEPAARIYRTGDRASFFDDGVICFLGRADGQVKVHGFRVELGEIEHRLRSHPEVKDVVVLAREDRSGDRRLAAYVVPAGADAPEVGELRRHAAAALPDYMVPNVVAFVDTFPATANGKLDRAALPWPVEPGSSHVLSPAAVSAEVEATVGPSASTVEELAAEIAEIFAEVLDVAAVAVDADVWNLGATSFTMIQVSAALQDRHGRRIPVSALLSDPTALGIARAVLGTTGGAVAAERPEASVVVAPVEPKPATAPKESIDFFSAEDRDAFKKARWDLRQARPGESALVLDDTRVLDAHFAWRASHREFADRRVSFAEFSKFLGLLREVEVDGRRQRLYASAGDTYAVQAYLHVRPGAVEGVAEGLYYYHPVDHALQLINAQPKLDRSIHFVYNRPVFDRAGFDLYLFGQADAIEPLYAEDTDRFLLLEAGYVGQLLMLAQASCGVGLCPIGTLALNQVRQEFGLNGSHRYLHAFLAGPADHLPADGARPLFADESTLRVHGTESQSQPEADPAPSPIARREIAVIGAAGRFAGADDLDAFWRDLSQGISSLTQVPPRRYGQIAGPGKRSRVGGFLADIDTFDSLLFHISPQEARTLDPQSRLLLHAVWECLETAGHSARSLGESAGRVGVFLGAMWQDYQHVGADRRRAGDPATISATASEIANRVSHFFDFDGPSVAVDTSCSSSLAAIHLAVESLRRGECGAAVVAAANILSHPYHLDLLEDLGLLATTVPDGAYDAAAPGWTPGEGVAALLLRPKEAAVAARDEVHGIIEATRIGHLGGAGRFGTPDAARLSASLTATLESAGLTPGEIGYVECAAAGAALADAAEAEALGTVFADRAEPVPVGTVKPNIGHLEAAAGLSQLTKVLLQLRHRQLAPTLLAARKNPLVSWPTAALRPVDRLTHWTPELADAPLRALVNAVGATGSYGHVIVRSAEPLAAEAPATTAEPQVVVLSAESTEQLAEQVDRLRDHLTAQRRARWSPAIADVAFTLQTGRAALSHRLVVACTSLDELLDALDAYRRGTAHPALVPASDEVAGWLAGGDLDWTTVRPSGAYRRVALPTYPFESAAHRIEPLSEPASEPAGAPAVADDAPVGAEAADEIRAVEEYLKTVYAELSGIAPERLRTTVPLEHYGLTSLLIAQLTARLRQDRGEVSTTLFFEHRDLAGAARALVADQPAVSDRSHVAVGSSPDSLDGRLAIIGMAGRYPEAPDLRRFWANLQAGRDSITPLPADRRRAGWPTDRMIGGFLDGVDRFDPLFFGITPREAALMDPQERLFLQTAWHTLEDAGYTRAKLRERHQGRAGVFVGSMYNEYPFFGVAQGAATGTADWQTSGSAIGGIANRVSYFLDLNGPSLTVDTMCSSSLTALHLAVTSLRRGECEVALVGGVNLSLHPNKFLQLDELKMSATDHRCRSFGAGGDGFVPGEGVGAVLLKPLAAALADGDRIHAVVLGTAVNHGGKTNGYTVPNPNAQGRLVARAMRDAGIDAATLGCLEAHGTGTALGDPIEVRGLTQAFAEAGAAPERCAIGSVKSNIGHLEAAAGIAGLTKAVLQLEHATLVPSLHSEQLNPDIAWSDTPFRVQRTVEAWHEVPGVPRRAGVSAFGAGGANAHAVIEAYDGSGVADVARPAVSGPQLIVLSARTEERLRVLSGELASFLRREPAVALVDVAHTLRFGREAMRERLSVVADDVAELAEVLEWFAAGVEAAVTRDRSDGELVDWQRSGDGGRLIGLPGYPFAQLRCWLAEPETPLLERRWTRAADIEGEGRAVGGDGTVLCLHRTAQLDLAGGLTRRFAPRRVVLLDEDAGYPDGLPDDVTGWLDLTALIGDDGSWIDRLRILQRTLAARPRAGVRVLQVTRGLLDMPGPVPSLAGARLAGFVRSLGAEFPWVQATVADVDAVGSGDTASQIVEAWHAVDTQSEICVRGGLRHQRELVATSVNADTRRLDPNRVYLITGGTRGLGALAARHLVAAGARRLAIIGATPLPPGHEWERDGVLVHTGGLADRAGLERFLTKVRSELGELAGVLHCAGRSTAGRPSFLHKEPADIQQVLAPKADGLDLLAELTSSDRLDFFVLYSSVSSAIPALAAGVSDYSAANAYLDYFAAHQARSGRPEFRAIQWPVWRETGGATAAPDVCAPIGLDSLTDAAGLRILDRVTGGVTAPVVLPTPWSAGAPADLGALLGSGGKPAGSGPGLLDQSAALRAPERSVAIAARATAEHVGTATDSPAVPTTAAVAVPGWLTDVFAATLGIPQPDLDPTLSFGELGVESVLLAELVTKIEAAWGRPLDPAALLDHPTLTRLAEYLADQSEDAVRQDEPPSPVGVRPATPPSSTGSQQIAVIGMACRFPGAPDLAAFWQLLRSGGCAVTEAPASRWDVAGLYDPAAGPGRTVSKWGGFVEGVEDFDAEFFGMGEGEARNLDPAIRLVLEGAESALRDAGYRDEELRGRDVGVFVGARMSGYRHRIGIEGAASGLGGDQNFIAARVAHHYDFRGPSLVVDSACSSALVSVQLACRSLLAGETSVALAGGVEVLLDEEPYLEFTAARALSPRGRCATFDRDADGFVPGEGCGVVVLKPLEHALRDGDRIHGVIDAVAVGNDGRTMGLTTPNPAAQADVVRRALAAAGRRAEEVAMLEAHGTATMIGDPIELRALTEVFRRQTDRSGFCAIGSVKSNVGHLLSAAGIAGLFKALLAVEHGEIPPTLFCETPNPRFDFAASPFYPNTALRSWPAGEPRVAGVSAFGLGGTNAHAIVTGLGAAPSSVRRAPLPPPVFRRRRLWWERTAPAGFAVPPEKDVPSTPIAPTTPELVASVLDLAFH